LTSDAIQKLLVEGVVHGPHRGDGELGHRCLFERSGVESRQGGAAAGAANEPDGIIFHGDGVEPVDGKLLARDLVGLRVDAQSEPGMRGCG